MSERLVYEPMFIQYLSLLLLAPTLVSGTLAAIIWMNRNRKGDQTGVLLLATIVLGSAISSSSYGLELILPELSHKMVMLSTRYIGAAIILPSTLLFALWYTRHDRWLSQWRVFLIYLPALVTLFIFLTNDLHHLYYPQVWLDAGYEIPQLQHENGPLYYIFRTCMAGYLLIALLILIRDLLADIYRLTKSGFLVFIGFLIPIFGQIAYLAELRPFGFLNLTDYCFSLSAILLTSVVFLDHSRILRPLAHDIIIRRLPSGMLLFDENFCLIEMNPSSSKMLNITEKRAIGKELDEILSPADPISIMVKGRKEMHTELLWSGRWYDLSLIILDQQEEVLGSLLLIRDITERKNAAEVLSQANRKLAMLSRITRHDILNQLTALMGYLEVGMDTTDRSQSDHLLQSAFTVSENIRDLINFTREFEEIGSQEPRWISLEYLIRSVSSYGRQLGIEIENNCSNAEIFADPLIPKVLYNLIDNAARHGESVTRILFSDEVRKEVLLLTCEDNGKGVPDEMKEKIFEQGVGKNTGLGLFLVREILAITGIHITETGEYGKGARFEIRIPSGMFR